MTEDAFDAPPPRRTRLLLLLPLLAFGALAALFAVRLGAGDPSRLPSTLIGRPAPATVIPPLSGLAGPDGRSLPGLSPADLARPGTVTVLNVWASWCAPCRLEHPLLARLAAEPGVRVVGINYKDKPDAALRFLRLLGNSFAAVGEDATGRAGIEWGVYGVPETFVIAPDGVVRFKEVGPLTSETLPAFLARVRAAARP